MASCFCPADRDESEDETSWGSDVELEMMRTVRLDVLQKSATATENYLMTHRRPRQKDQNSRAFMDEAFRNDPLLCTLEPHERAQLVETIEFFQFGEGETVIHQGALGTYLFVVERGELDVFEDDGQVASLESGECFGTIAVLFDCPRTASVCCSSAVSLWGCDGRVFRQFLRNHSKNNYRENRIFMDSIKLFDGLSGKKKDTLSEACVSMIHPAGSVVIAEGQQGRAMYVVKKGELRVVVGCDSNQLLRGAVYGGQEVQLLHAGDCFGERALLYNERRQATVQAICQCEVMSIGFEKLTEVLGEQLTPTILQDSVLLTGIKTSPVFAKFSASQQHSLVHAMEMVSYSPGEDIEDAPFSLVVEGSVMGIPAGSVVGLLQAAVMTRGQWFGDAGLVEIQQSHPMDHAMRNILGYVAITAQKPQAVGYKVDDFQRIYAGDDQCKLAVLTSEALAEAMQGMGMGATDHEEAVDYARKVHIIHDIYIFHYLSRRQCDRVVDALQVQIYNCGATVFQQGEYGTAFYIVASGEVAVVKDGKRLRTLGENSYFGERALYFDEPRSASIQIVSPRAEIWSIDKEVFMSIMKGKVKGLIEERIALHDTTMRLKDLRHVKVLGKGSFGVVRLVQHVRSGFQYALKRVKKVNGQTDAATAHECNMLSKVDHPFMMYLVKTFDTPQNVYMLTELLPGGDLKDLLTSYDLSDVEDARFYVGSLVVALEALHNNGIAHRDVKPENMMLDSQGYVKLIDFGLSKALMNGSRTFTLCGTPHYMAPEVWKFTGYGMEVDVWSMTVILYEFLCRRVPFGRGITTDCAKVCTAILTEELNLPDWMDYDAQDLIHNVLSYKTAPKQRLGSSDRHWCDIKEHPFFAKAGEGDQTYFDMLQSHDIEAPIMRESDDGQRTKPEDQLSDAHELA
eukprot:TRINITY_DN19840_c0_g1_i1.p1 TRINITY_DN19840_c0_g1~~TRINITY_DN19840_c0_g1_i1.p1  ORF type:complete len:910 (-),score=156.98 TRINITY_DN19840_c0_g1_i1:245-2974(-)